MGDAKGVLSSSDFQAINSALGKAIATVPTSQVMDVYNEMSKFIGTSSVPNYLYSQVKPGDAQAAYNALLQFKDVVKAARLFPRFFFLFPGSRGPLEMFAMDLSCRC